jgi:hypothetical protein
MTYITSLFSKGNHEDHVGDPTPIMPDRASRNYGVFRSEDPTDSRTANQSYLLTLRKQIKIS